MFKNGPVFLAHPVIVWLYVVFIDSLGLPFLSSKHEDKPTTETEAGFALLSLWVVSLLKLIFAMMSDLRNV